MESGSGDMSCYRLLKLQVAMLIVDFVKGRMALGELGSSNKVKDFMLQRWKREWWSFVVASTVEIPSVICMMVNSPTFGFWHIRGK